VVERIPGEGEEEEVIRLVPGRIMIPGSSLQEVLKDVDNARHAFAKAYVCSNSELDRIFSNFNFLQTSLNSSNVTKTIF